MVIYNLNTCAEYTFTCIIVARQCVFIVAINEVTRIQTVLTSGRSVDSVTTLNRATDFIALEATIYYLGSEGLTLQNAISRAICTIISDLPLKSTVVKRPISAVRVKFYAAVE